MIMAAWTLSLGRGGYFFEESKKRSPNTTNANIINPRVFFIPPYYHKSVTGKGKLRSVQCSPCTLPCFIRAHSLFPSNLFTRYYQKASIRYLLNRYAIASVSLAEMFADEFGHLKHRYLALSAKDRLRFSSALISLLFTASWSLFFLM